MGIDTSTSEGKKLFAQLMSLNGKFAEVTDAAKELADAQAEAAEAARKAAEDAAEAARKAAEDAAEAARKAAEEQQKVLDSLVAALQKNVDSAFSAMQKAYQDLQKVQERFLNYSKNIRAYLDELTGGRSAYISPEERYRIARQEFQRVSALAAIGDETALGEITQAGKDFLDASREYNASSQQFQDDFAVVTSALESSAGYAEAQANLAANQLRVAESSYSALVTLNNSTMGVMSAISSLNTTMTNYANAVAGLAAFKGATGYSGGVITDSGGQVAYDPGAPMGSPTNPIPMPRQTPIFSFAEGGTMPAGLSLVGEYGPELVSSGGGYVSSAGATANFFKTIKDAVVITSAQQTELLKEQVAELQALVRLQSAANRELITQLSEIRSETSEATRIAKVEASS
jgi:chemotaxis protein histidine kinase CheA